MTRTCVSRWVSAKCAANNLTNKELVAQLGSNAIHWRSGQRLPSMPDVCAFAAMVNADPNEARGALSADLGFVYHIFPAHLGQDLDNFHNATSPQARFEVIDEVLLGLVGRSFAHPAPRRVSLCETGKVSRFQVASGDEAWHLHTLLSILTTDTHALEMERWVSAWRAMLGGD